MAAAIQPTPPVPASPAHPLRERNYRLLWMGNSISWMGDQFYVVAMPWLVLQLTGSAVALGAILMTAAIPRAVLMLIGGAMTDRISARRIMIATAWLRTLLVAALAALVWFHLLHLWHIYVLAFAFGSADAFYSPAAQAFLPSLLKPEQLPAANSVSQSTLQITTLVGPAPAAMVVKALGTAWAFIIDAISFLFIIGALWQLPDPPLRQSVRKSMWNSIAEGLRYVGNDAALRSLLLVIAMINFCVTGPMGVSLAWIAKQRFGSPLAFAVLTSSLAGGSLLGMILAGLKRQQRNRGWLLLGVSSFTGLSVGVLGILHYLWLMAAVLLLMAMAVGFLNIQLISWFQQRVDRAVLGRVMSVLMFAAIGLMPVSLAAAGLALKWSLPGMFAVAGALVLLVTALATAHRPVREIQ
ncbi:MAG TPA: MFS transporter [Candidatus Angelobacter sp.]|nr:MFS transporter [Candidatus Angelobacter sp.]